ncbi:acid protease [Gyrodon lividus]|nr:acid protease [Gyrodon lividus]
MLKHDLLVSFPPLQKTSLCGMRFTLATFVTALPLFIAAVPQPAKQGGTAIPLFKRSSLLNSDNSVNVDPLKSHVASTRAKILRGLDNYEKNTGTLYPYAVKGARKRATGAVPLADLVEDWFGIIEIGTPAVPYKVMFDTGSSDVILPGPDCGRSCDGHSRYVPRDSSTSLDMDKTFDFTYMDGDRVFGNLYNDTILLAELRAVEQTMGAASVYPVGMQFSRTLADGLIGLAFQEVSAYNERPVFHTLISDGQIDEPVFAISLAAPGPELYLGGTNPDMYTGDFTYTPVIVPGFWLISIDRIVANGETVLDDVDCVIDTGTDLIWGHHWHVRTIYRAVGGTDASDTLYGGYYTFPCDEVPDIRFAFGDTSFPISINTGATFPGSEDCVGAIVGADLGELNWIVGSTFLRNVYTAFDVGNMRVGFAAIP